MRPEEVMLDETREAHVLSRLLIDDTLLEIVVPLYNIEQPSISNITPDVYDKVGTT
jgi:hypothetical protein